MSWQFVMQTILSYKGKVLNQQHICRVKKQFSLLKLQFGGPVGATIGILTSITG